MQGVCSQCGATVDLAREESTGEPVPLELGADAATEAPRYRVLRFEKQHSVVERVDPGTPGAFQPDHRFDCPGFNAGRR